MTPGNYADSGQPCGWGVPFDGQEIRLAYAPRPVATGQPPPHQPRPVAPERAPAYKPAEQPRPVVDPVSRILEEQGICLP